MHRPPKSRINARDFVGLPIGNRLIKIKDVQNKKRNRKRFAACIPILSLADLTTSAFVAPAWTTFDGSTEWELNSVKSFCFDLDAVHAGPVVPHMVVAPLDWEPVVRE